jgi:carbamoyl-phosphate synthase large subunit
VDGPPAGETDGGSSPGKGARTDEGRIRAASVQYGVPCITTLPAAEACVLAMEALRTEQLEVQAIQDRFSESVAAR